MQRERAVALGDGEEVGLRRIGALEEDVGSAVTIEVADCDTVFALNLDGGMQRKVTVSVDEGFVVAPRASESQKMSSRPSPLKSPTIGV